MLRICGRSAWGVAGLWWVKGSVRRGAGGGGGAARPRCGLVPVFACWDGTPKHPPHRLLTRLYPFLPSAPRPLCAVSAGTSFTSSHLRKMLQQYSLAATVPLPPSLPPLG
jgi:hypothetical protein